MQLELERVSIGICFSLVSKYKLVSIPAFDDKELKIVVGKLDLLYAALLTTQEQYFNTQSNTQVIRLRIDLKERAIERKKILFLSKPNGVSFKTPIINNETRFIFNFLP